jgi:hypothetical protein
MLQKKRFFPNRLAWNARTEIAVGISLRGRRGDFAINESLLEYLIEEQMDQRVKESHFFLV